MPDDLLTLTELAEYLSMSRHKVYRLAKARKIPASKVGGVWRFNREHIDEWRIAREHGMDDRVMTAKDVAAYMKVHSTTIYRLMKRQQLPAFQIGGEWRFNLEHIDEWRAAQEKRLK